MNKAKGFLLAAAAAAMGFTFGCTSGDDGGSGTCGGKEYDTKLGYSCVNGEIVGYCKGQLYYPEYDHCENGEVTGGTAISSSSGGRSSGGGSSSSGGLLGGTAPAIATPSLPSGAEGAAYSQVVTATGDAPITWSLESGALPSGLNLMGNGIISGTPTTAGTFSFIVKATNATGSDMKALSITIATAGDNPNPGGSSSSGGGNVVYGTSVTYGGETYQTVVIGTQTWFAKNLNYDADGSVCYNNEQFNCATYGRLYNWATAMNLPSSCNENTCSGQIGSPHKGICPSGWHLPSNDDWDKLFRYVDEQNGGRGEDGTPYDSYTAGKYLKATSGWSSNGNGTDQYGFSALPGGSGSSDGSFDDVGNYGYWWSASEDNSYYAYRRIMDYYDEYAYWTYRDKSYLFSVRCLQD